MTRTAKAVMALRRKLGISQRAFGDRLGTTITTVSRYENAHIEPGEEVLRKLAKLAESGGLHDLRDFFANQRRLGIVARVESLPSAGTQRRVSVDDLESWTRFARQIAGTLQAQVDLLESSARQVPNDRIELPAMLFGELLGNLRGARGEVEYVADEMQLYVGGPDTSRIEKEREEGREAHGKK